MGTGEHVLNEQFCKAGDVELCFETLGDPADPAVLLVMGLGMQMVGWPAEFCEGLVERGFFLIRYDNRDTGRSTHFVDTPPPTSWELVSRRPRNLAYTLADLADDGVALLDHLGIQRAHVVGVSMGGMIAQVLAGRHPGRVASLASIMSMTGSRIAGQPAAKVYPLLLGRVPKGREEFVERALKLFRVIGSRGFERDDDELREMAELSYDRGADPAGTARQLAAIVAAGNRTAECRRITAPTVVIHGKRDPMIALSGGRATARAIPGSKLIVIDGMGHDLPRGAWPQMLDAIAENAARAREPVSPLA
ncbi:MAG: alpha/beta fold hydrolase [Thermoleophilaceae bacterium]